MFKVKLECFRLLSSVLFVQLDVRQVEVTWLSLNLFANQADATKKMGLTWLADFGFIDDVSRRTLQSLRNTQHHFFISFVSLMWVKTEVTLFGFGLLPISAFVKSVWYCLKLSMLTTFSHFISQDDKIFHWTFPMRLWNCVLHFFSW